MSRIAARRRTSSVRRRHGPGSAVSPLLIDEPLVAVVGRDDQLARAGLGTAVVPRSFSAELTAPAGRTAAILDLTDGLATTVGAYTRPDVTLAAARALLDLAVASPRPPAR